ncbi:MAG TPA: hypothetical protein VMW52_06010, partial [Phycisphaerae bacterium]|nr:hypothetical protein [Phycisphaerae bacterium]
KRRLRWEQTLGWSKLPEWVRKIIRDYDLQTTATDETVPAWCQKIGVYARDNAKAGTCYTFYSLQATIKRDKAIMGVRDRNAHNRRRPNYRVHGYASDMRNGLWWEVNDPIRFDPQGIIADGQTRLAGFVQTGLDEYTFSFAIGIPLDSFPAIDNGGVRTGGDTLYTLRSPTPRSKSKAMTLVLRYHDGNLHTRKTPSLTNNQRRDRNDEFGQLLDRAAALAGSYSPALRRADYGPFMALYVILTIGGSLCPANEASDVTVITDPERAAAYFLYHLFYTVHRTADEHCDSPIRKLPKQGAIRTFRDKSPVALKNLGETQYITNATIIWVIQAWNAMMAAEPTAGKRRSWLAPGKCDWSTYQLPKAEPVKSVRPACRKAIDKWWAEMASASDYVQAKRVAQAKRAKRGKARVTRAADAGYYAVSELLDLDPLATPDLYEIGARRLIAAQDKADTTHKQVELAPQTVLPQVPSATALPIMPTEATLSAWPEYNTKAIAKAVNKGKKKKTGRATSAA